MKKITTWLLATVMVAALWPAGASAQGMVSVKSEFVMELAVPGAVDHFLRPGRVYYDAVADEVFVYDEGNNRLVVFSSDGAYKCEFALAGRVGTVIDFAVSPSGLIYVLGSTQEGRKLLTFDFDGSYVGELATDPTALAGMEFSSLTFGQDGHLYLLDTKSPQIVALNAGGDVALRFPIASDFQGDDGGDLILGALSSTVDGILVPLSSYGVVNLYSPEGGLLATYGYKGTTTGELAFPVSAVWSADGIISVLDKQRFAVLCYSPDGKCLGEFGGRGSSPGWFYYPSYLASDGAGRLIISQVFNNRVQVCRIPDAIRGQLGPGDAGDSHGQVDDKTAGNDLVEHIQHPTTQGGL